jgi:predicted small secreted protein
MFKYLIKKEIAMRETKILARQSHSDGGWRMKRSILTILSAFVLFGFTLSSCDKRRGESGSDIRECDVLGRDRRDIFGRDKDGYDICGRDIFGRYRCGRGYRCDVFGCYRCGRAGFGCDKWGDTKPINRCECDRAEYYRCGYNKYGRDKDGYDIRGCDIFGRGRKGDMII